MARGHLLLREIAVKTGCGLSKLRLLRGLLSNNLPGLHTTLLLLLERRHCIGLRLRVALIKKVGDRARTLLHQPAFKFRTLHALALAAERTRAYRLCRKPLLGNRTLTVDLPHRFVDDLLLIRVHEGRGFLPRTEPADPRA